MKRKTAAVVIDAPRFRSEAEEAEWWDSHQDLVADLLLNMGGAPPYRPKASPFEYP